MESRGWLTSILMVGLVLCVAFPARAQFQTPEQLGFSYAVTAGAMIPVNKNANLDVSPTVGVSWYGEAGSDFGDGAAFGLSGDWTIIKRDDGKSVNVVPVLINYKRYGIIGAYRVFVNMGIGIIAATDSINAISINKGASFGWTGGLGFDISNNLFTQARFIGGQKPGEDGLVSIQAGYRF